MEPVDFESQSVVTLIATGVFRRAGDFGAHQGNDFDFPTNGHRLAGQRFRVAIQLIRRVDSMEDGDRGAGGEKKGDGCQDRWKKRS